jgi:hypothetical protein
MRCGIQYRIIGSKYGSSPKRVESYIIAMGRRVHAYLIATTTNRDMILNYRSPYLKRENTCKPKK